MVHSLKGFCIIITFTLHVHAIPTYRIYWLYGYVSQVYIAETKQSLETRLREHQDTWAVREGWQRSQEDTQEDHHPIIWEEASVLDRARDKGEGGPPHIQMTLAEECLSWDRGLHGNPGLQDHIDEETWREEQSSPLTSNDIYI